MSKIKKPEVDLYLHALKYTYASHFLLLFAYISLHLITEPISEPASSVGIETRLRERQPGYRGSIPGTDKRLLSRSALGSNQPPTWELGGRSMELTIHDHLTPILRRTGAASPKFTFLHSVHKRKLLSNPVNIVYMRRDSLLVRSRKEYKVCIYGSLRYGSGASFLCKKENKFSVTTTKRNSEKKSLTRVKIYVYCVVNG